MNNSSRSGLFLMELIIVILFFSICSAVCVQMFSNTHLIDSESSETSHASLVMQNLAEVFEATSGDFSSEDLLPDGSILSSDGRYIYIFFDEDWNTTAPDSEITAFTAVLYSDYPDEDTSNGGLMIHGKAYVLKSEGDMAADSLMEGGLSSADPIISQDLESYIPYRAEVSR